MPFIRSIQLVALIVITSFNLSAQCNHTLAINSYSASCNGNGLSSVDINVTVLFGNGNNSATLSYNTGMVEVVSVVLQDDDGDLINQDYSFLVPSCGDFTVTLTAWTNPSGSGSSCSDPAPIVAPIILPVDFGDFRLQVENSNVELFWETYAEINNERFEIERSYRNDVFERVGVVDGATNSNSLQTYTFEDQLPDIGTYYYRIKQVDLDGKFSFSETRSITFVKENQLIAYPNPAEARINISTANSGKFRIVDVSGKVVKEVFVQDDATTVDVSELDAGIYILVNSEGTASFRLMKI